MLKQCNSRLVLQPLSNAEMVDAIVALSGALPDESKFRDWLSGLREPALYERLQIMQRDEAAARYREPELDFWCGKPKGNFAAQAAENTKRQRDGDEVELIPAAGWEGFGNVR